MGYFIVYITESQVISSKEIVFLSLKIFFVFVNSVEPGEVPHDANYHTQSRDCTGFFLHVCKRGYENLQYDNEETKNFGEEVKKK